MKKGINKVTCGDCLEVMKDMDDNSVDLVLTDPPYGIDVAKGEIFGGAGVTSNTKHTKSDWDKFKPTKEYFNEMIRVSKNQVIFGGNYFTDYLEPSGCWVTWDKRCGILENNFADCELAWTSFNKPSKVIRYLWAGMLQKNMKVKEKRQHPTQKPLPVMKELVEMFSKKGDTILDPFLGSGTTAVACKELGRNFIGIEISKEYCKIAEDRLRQEVLLT
jgi:site-specific DNA-methyltransferase (adenine-specific)